MRISRNIVERCDDILTALVTSAPTEAEMAAALARGVSVEHATDLVSALTELAVVRTFVKDYGWSFDKWEKWTVATLCDLVLKPT